MNLKKLTTFIITSKGTKYSGGNLTKVAQHLYTASNKTLLR